MKQTLRLGPLGTLRVEVADARGDRSRVCVHRLRCGESGRGLRMVAAHVGRWGVDEAPAHRKTVGAELSPGRTDR